MKKFILVLVVLFAVLAGGGVAAWFLYFEQQFGLENEEEEIAEIEQEAEPELLEMEALSIPIIRNGELQKYILVNVSLELDAEESRLVVYERMTKLEDAFFRDLHGYFGTVSDTKRVSVRTLSVRLYRQGIKILGKDRLVKVHIVGAYERD